jgi:dTMP kinase
VLQGKFFSLEGGEGSGKTTQIYRFKDHLEQNGLECVLTRQPGGTRIGAKIRAILLDPENKDLDPTAELFLYLADRAQHVRKYIQPELDRGKVVISDRYDDSTMVYQGVARGLDLNHVKLCNSIATGGLETDLTFYLDIDPETGIGRAFQALDASRANESRFEEESIRFHEEVRSGFLDWADQYPGRIKIIDASPSKEDVTAQLVSTLEEYMRSL